MAIAKIIQAKKGKWSLFSYSLINPNTPKKTVELEQKKIKSCGNYRTILSLSAILHADLSLKIYKTLQLAID